MRNGFAPVLGPRPGANGSQTASPRLPPLNRSGAPTGSNEGPPIQKPGRRVLSGRGAAEEASAHVLPPKVPKGLAPPPALPMTRDLVAPPKPPVSGSYSARGVAGERLQ